jgi:hypothetical protein
MKDNRTLSLGKQMNRDSSPFNLKETEYSFALNTMFESESGDSYNPKNEYSNILAVKFSEGFKVVGHKNDINEDRTFFFLANPLTNVSEIGYIKNSTRNVVVDDSIPLEEQTQEPYSQFVILLNDSLSKCLNLDVDFPVKKIEIKKEKLGTTLYWADNKNPDRSFVVEKVKGYINTGIVNCDKLRIDKKHILPTITPVSIEAGGQLEKGVYEFLITYCDKLGNEIAEYVSITNPVHIFNNNDRVIATTELNDKTNQAIKLLIEGLDTQYKYYKVAIIQKLSDNTSYFSEGIHPINDKEIIISSVQDKKRIDLNKILASKTTYVKSEGVTSSNGYLFRYGLTAEKEWNLQPITNLLGAFVRWQTVEAKEDLYERGEASSLFKGYYRDEVYPLSWRIKTNTGYVSANFPFISRPATEFIGEDQKVVNENAVIENLDTKSVNTLNPNCSQEERNKYWQFYNTAHDVERCTDFQGNTTIVTQPVNKFCISENFSSLEDVSIYLDISEVPNFTTFTAYLEEFGNNLTANLPNDYNEEIYNNAELQSILTDERKDENCSINYRDNCIDPTLIQSNIFLGDIENEKINPSAKDKKDYELSKVVQFSYIHDVNTEGRGKVDEEFKAEFSTNEPYPFSRASTTNAERCVSSINSAQVSEANENSSGLVMQYYADLQQSNLQESTVSEIVGAGFTNKIHKGAIWIKSSIKDTGKAIIEVTKWKKANFNDLFSSAKGDFFNTIGNHNVRVSVYKGRCTNLEFVKAFIVDVREGALLTGEGEPILESEVGSEDFYIVIDPPIVQTPAVKGYVTAVINGVFGLEVRAEEYKSATIHFDKISVSKQQKYELSCDFEVPIFDECEPQPYKSGKFSYWESIEKYPDNKELFDSSTLEIDTIDIDDSIKVEFEKFFVASKINNKYLLKQDTNFANKPIRHFKFPDFNVAPFMSTNLIVPFSQSYIYPLGVTISKKAVNSFLDIAVKNKLISQEQRDSITSFEMFRGDRRVNKSILGKGIAYDMYDYEEKVTGDKVLFSNFPFNDLGDNKLSYADEKRTSFIKHPYKGNRNNKFTFHSPEYDYYDLNIGAETKIEAFQYGTSRGNFVDVEDHPTWVILGERAYKKAKDLAILEFALETAIRLAENLIQASQNYWFIGGLGSTGGNPWGAIGATGFALGLSGFEALVNVVPVVGRYRYEWLKIFRDLGQPENFATQYVAEGFYNYAEPNYWYEGGSKSSLGNSLRAISTGKELKEGRYTFTEKTGEQLKVNNLDREKSLLLTFGNDYLLEYPAGYKTYDNGNEDSYGSSRSIQSDSGVCMAGKSPEIKKNIASPYMSLKNYVPFQYGSISSIKWLQASKSVNLDGDNTCYSIFGGDIFISRYTLKRKVPLFTDTAFGLAPLTPYNYYRNSNLGYTRFYCNYELGNEKTIGDILFPDFESEYVFDCQTASSGSYVKPPSKMYLNYYGIPNFLVESELNLNLRYGKKEPRNNFYPEVGDFVDWTQETNVPIREPNRLYYNNVYSSTVSEVSYRTLPDYYSKEEFDILYDSPNGVIYSMQDTSENDLTDPWAIFRPLDYYQFPSSYGKLLDLKGIESAQVLGRFENTSVIFNAVNQYKDAQDAASRELGTGGIFAARPMEFSNTELGYGGTGTYQIVSNEYGHFYPDTDRGQVFQAGAKSLQEISSVVGGKPVGMKAWFKEHLPFKIKNSLVENYEFIDTDNAFNGVGITMGWDAKFDRVLLTKIDYIPLQEMYYCGSKFLDFSCNSISYCEYTDKELTIQNYLDQGYRYLEEDCQLIFQKVTESCTYSFNFCTFPDKETKEQALISTGYNFIKQVDCSLEYEKVEEICDEASKQTEIQALLTQGYVPYQPTSCDYTTVQSEIDTLMSQGYTEILDSNCVKTLQKATVECDPNSKQTEINNLLAQGYVQVSKTGCDILFERNTDLSGIANGTSSTTVDLIDFFNNLNFIVGVANGTSTAQLTLSTVSPPLLQGSSNGSADITGVMVRYPNAFTYSVHNLEGNKVPYPLSVINNINEVEDITFLGALMDTSQITTHANGSRAFTYQVYDQKGIYDPTQINNTVLNRPPITDTSGVAYNYIYDYSQGAGLSTIKRFYNMSNDWIVWYVYRDEENGNNQRNSFDIFDKDNLGVSFSVRGNLVYYNEHIPGISNNNGYGYSMPSAITTDTLFTLYKINNTVNLKINNTGIIFNLTSTTEMDGVSSTGVRIGTAGIDGNLGRINKFKTLSMIARPNLSTFDISSENQRIMNIHGITP